MNKQEAIERIESRAFNIEDTDLVVGLSFTKNIINQINEQQKVVIPKFVAEYIERCKQSGWHLQKVLSRLDDDEKVGDWAYDENDDLISEKVDMVAHAWLFGYEVEQEQLYTVEIPNPNTNAHTILQRAAEGIVIMTTSNARWRGWPNSKLTESEIKQDFEWAWDAGFAKEME
ncbi:DUF1642 domain-containing protein [Streptococcus suis]|uniref:DUF1642 domain-containing protein n=1 Tax=Streptococcus suis TaxID=1307 RepID=UPI00201ABF90|nr:DUF1642 domain-containing protein [Streptococcus suis]MCL4882638.1 DUF1642 domain-containing protein [Streptococcus suis]